MGGAGPLPCCGCLHFLLQYCISLLYCNIVSPFSITICLSHYCACLLYCNIVSSFCIAILFHIYFNIVSVSCIAILFRFYCNIGYVSCISILFHFYCNIGYVSCIAILSLQLKRLSQCRSDLDFFQLNCDDILCQDYILPENELIYYQKIN